MILYRHADPRFPFLWEGTHQPPGRWNGDGEGPVQYFSDTPDGAWAELLRHEEITEPDDVATLRRALWAVEAPGVEDGLAVPRLSRAVATGGKTSYPSCRKEARRLRAAGAAGIVAPCAALVPGGAAGLRVDAGPRPGPPRDGRTVALFGPRPELVGWRAVLRGHPDPALLERVRPL